MIGVDMFSRRQASRTCAARGGAVPYQVRKRLSTARDVYIEDELLLQVWECAEQSLRDALDLFYLTGQRIAATLKMDESHIRDKQLWVQQGKTGANRRIELVGELKALLDRIAARKELFTIKPKKAYHHGGRQPDDVADITH